MTAASGFANIFLVVLKILSLFTALDGANATKFEAGGRRLMATDTYQLPPQHLFHHGRKCGLQNATRADKKAAKAVRPRSEIAEGSVNIPVNVHFHVISKGLDISLGNIPDSWIHNQIATLQSAHNIAGFVFTLASVTRTVNDAWYSMAQGSPEEV